MTCSVGGLCCHGIAGAVQRAEGAEVAFGFPGGPEGKSLSEKAYQLGRSLLLQVCVGYGVVRAESRWLVFFSFSRLARRRPSLLGRRGVEELDVHMP